MLFNIFLFLIGNKWAISINLVVGALFLIPIIPVGIAFANEVTYPLEEPVIVGFLFMASYTIGFILALVTLKFTEIEQIYGLMVLPCCSAVAAFISLFVKEDLRQTRLAH